jgi:hypothetical protein
MTEENVVKLMESSASEKQWNKNASAVKKEFNGYPSFWFGAVVVSGVAANTALKWSS